MLLTSLPADATEGDVETLVVVPILTRAEFLGVDLSRLRSKEFLSPVDIGKGRKKQKGYVPDFCIYMLSIPIVAIEVKAPTVQVEIAWTEAQLYAHALNSKFISRINPCEFVFCSNGVDFCAGFWDSDKPVVAGKISELTVGSRLLSDLQSLMGSRELERRGEIANAAIKMLGFKRPFAQASGPAMIASKLEANTFAADLAPILRRYFSSRDQNKDPEIYKNAYVSSNEITSYDRVLESFLVDRLSRSRSRVEVKTTRRRAESVSRRIGEMAAQRLPTGDLQLITGGVGTGKSLFARRYKEYLEPEEMRPNTHWAFLDFNFAPEQLATATDWVCTSFVESILEEGAPINLRDADDQERIFSSDIADREAYYSRMESASPNRGALEKARDIEGWRQDSNKLARGIARHLQGDRAEIVIAVFDNVDRRDVANQLAAFQLALWFMDQTGCLIILQMRDTTFEAYKNERPLDTYKTGQIFHISPPRFIDVVKRRLELSLSRIEIEAPTNIKYSAPSGVNISFPRERAGTFLRTIYIELFQRPTNTSRILESLAGRNVRKALDMFVSIINSGHMPEDMITNIINGHPLESFPDELVLKILMRQDYRFFSDSSGFISNIFYCDPNWIRPSNLLICEILFFLIKESRSTGDNGQMGFVSVGRVQRSIEKFGYVGVDITSAAKYLVEKELLEADSASFTTLSEANCLKATAGGWSHMRLIASNPEYIYSILPTTAVTDDALRARIYDFMEKESRFGSLLNSQRIELIRRFQEYIRNQFTQLRTHPGYNETSTNGASYILTKIKDALQEAEGKAPNKVVDDDWLDA